MPCESRFCGVVKQICSTGCLCLALIVCGQPHALGQQDDVPSATPPPPPATFQNVIPSDQLAFLNDYAGKSTKEIMKDKRFHALMKATTPRTTYHYGQDMSLSNASEVVLSGTPLPVDVRDGRYVLVGTRGGNQLSGRGFLWFDIKEGIALGGVYFHPINGEPTPTLAIFSKQLNINDLAMSQLPQAFAQDVERWAEMAAIPAISPRYFIPENGKKYVLVHDEDYCGPTPGLNGRPLNVCMQMNADAAEADLNAAYFMKEMHNAANATAWMLTPEQLAWIGFRDQRCGFGPNALPCRIRITRIRTRIYLGRPS